MGTMRKQRKDKEVFEKMEHVTKSNPINQATCLIRNTVIQFATPFIVCKLTDGSTARQGQEGPCTWPMNPSWPS